MVEVQAVIIYAINSPCQDKVNAAINKQDTSIQAIRVSVNNNFFFFK